MVPRFALTISLLCCFPSNPAAAQQPAGANETAGASTYATRPSSAPTGMAPGLKATELEKASRTFQITFSKGDEVAAGLAEFAQKNNLRTAHFTAIGAFGDAVLGWYDPEKRAYKTTKLSEEMEIASFSGNITRDRNGKPVVHAHCVLSLGDGTVKAGHFLEGHISLTMQMFLTDSAPLPASAAESR